MEGLDNSARLCLKQKGKGINERWEIQAEGIRKRMCIGKMKRAEENGCKIFREIRNEKRRVKKG